MTPPVRIGDVDVELIGAGEYVRIDNAHTANGIVISVEDAHRLQSVGLPAVLPPKPVNGLAAVRKHQ